MGHSRRACSTATSTAPRAPTPRSGRSVSVAARVFTAGHHLFTAGTTEWAWGLAVGDRFVEHITRNVLERAERDRAGRNGSPKSHRI